MQGELKASLYYFTANIRHSLMYFWIILLSILLMAVLSDLLFMRESDGLIIFNLSAPIYIYTAIVAQITVNGSLPYLIKMGATRKNLLISATTCFFGLAVVNAFIANSIQSLVMVLYRMTSVNGNVRGSITVSDGQDSFSFSHVAFLVQDTWLTRLAIDTSIMFLFMAFSFVLGLIFYRYGLIGGFGFLGIIALTIIIGMANGWLLEFFISIFNNISMIFFIQLFFIGLTLFLFSYVLLRRFTIKE